LLQGPCWLCGEADFHKMRAEKHSASRSYNNLNTTAPNQLSCEKCTCGNLKFLFWNFLKPIYFIYLCSYTYYDSPTSSAQFRGFWYIRWYCVSILECFHQLRKKPSTFS
jgi:hypothetical protein